MTDNTDSSKEIDGVLSDTDSTTPAFRVRNVSEINSTSDEVKDESQSQPRKRKLPLWLSSPSPVSSNGKKSKTDEVASSSTDDGERSNDQASLTSAPITSNGAYSMANGVNDPQPSTSNANEEEIVDPPRPIQVKIEAKEEVKVEPDSDDGLDSIAVQASVKSEPSEDGAKEAVTSTTRDSCKFGIRCYRRNPLHRTEEAHPGDADYRRPTYPAPPKGTPDCPFGDQCYRRNPIHFQEYSHPPSTDFKKNWKIRQARLKKKPNYTNSNDDDDEYDLEDPFIDDDSEDDFVPDEDDEEDTEEFSQGD